MVSKPQAMNLLQVLGLCINLVLIGSQKILYGKFICIIIITHIITHKYKTIKSNARAVKTKKKEEKFQFRKSPLQFNDHRMRASII